MNSDDLKYRLIRGLNIPYMGVKVKQPTIESIDDDKVGLLVYSNYNSLYILRKEHLNMNDELKELTQNSSFFETLFIIDGYLHKNGLFNRNNIPHTDMLIMSLLFFLDIDVNNNLIEKNIETKNIRIISKTGQEIFRLDNNNFDEFSELIRLICNCEKLEVESEKPKLKTVKYDDPAIQKIYEDLLNQHTKDEEKKKKDNELTMATVIGAICVNDKAKYNYKNISELTIWQLFYQFYSMFSKESIETTKMQFTSGNFKFDQVPDLDWSKKVKVTIPENNKLLK